MVSKNLLYARTTPQAEHKHCGDDSISIPAPQNGQTVSDAEGISASFSRKEGSLGERKRCQSVRTAPSGAPMHITQKNTRSSGVRSTAHAAAPKMSRTTNPAHLNPRRVPG